MKAYPAAMVLVLAVLVTSCARPPDVTLNLKVHTEDPAVVEEVRRILMYRFGEFPPSFFSSIESKVDGSNLSFLFNGGAPPQSILSYLYETQGNVRALLVERIGVLFTDRDIERADLMYEDERHMLLLRLTQAAGDRVHALTTRNIGKTVRITLDDRVLLEATIVTVLRHSFKTLSPEQNPEKAMPLVVVLRSGALPAAVSLAGDANGMASAD